jgi:hypothetical protein
MFRTITLQPKESVATGAARTNRELVADESEATVGEDRRTTCTLLVAIADGRAPEPAALRGDAGPDRTATGADGIER